MPRLLSSMIWHKVREPLLWCFGVGVFLQALAFPLGIVFCDIFVFGYLIHIFIEACKDL